MENGKLWTETGGVGPPRRESNASALALYVGALTTGLFAPTLHFHAY